MATEARFVPVRPARPERPGPVLLGLMRPGSGNVVAGWSELAFTEWHTRRNLLGTVIHFPRHPDAIERVLLTNAANYEKPRIVKRIVAPLIGRGLVSSDGTLWRSQRKMVAPSFAPGAVGKLIGTMAEAAERSAAGWPERGRIDVAATATATTMAIISEALFSGDPRLTDPQAARQIEAALLAAGQVRLMALLGMERIRFGRVAREGERGRRYLRETLTQIVRERGPEGGEDFLGGMIRALNTQFDGAEATALAIDNAATFYVAGHETTANALAWSLYLMAGDQRVQDRARAEAVAALEGPSETLPDRLPYLRQVLDEALRLYPPAPRFDREALGHDEIHGQRVRRGELVSVWPWLLHRHQGLWENADGFDPDRFAPGREGERHRFQYIPFGAGPRVCVGARFATVEALVILAHWLAKRRFGPVPGFAVEPLGAVTLRPKHGLMVEVSPT